MIRTRRESFAYRLSHALIGGEDDQLPLRRFHVLAEEVQTLPETDGIQKGEGVVKAEESRALGIGAASQCQAESEVQGLLGAMGEMISNTLDTPLIARPEAVLTVQTAEQRVIAPGS